MDYSTDTLLDDKMLITIVLIIGFFLVFTLLKNTYLPFKANRDYIKMEMSRANEKEYEYWKKRLRMLYLRSIPIVRWFFRRKR